MRRVADDDFPARCRRYPAVRLPNFVFLPTSLKRWPKRMKYLCMCPVTIIPPGRGSRVGPPVHGRGKPGQVSRPPIARTGFSQRSPSIQILSHSINRRSLHHTSVRVLGSNTANLCVHGGLCPSLEVTTPPPEQCLYPTNQHSTQGGSHMGLGTRCTDSLHHRCQRSSRFSTRDRGAAECQ